MSAAILVVHIIVCVVIILIILLQQGKGAEMGATFGVSAQGSAVFGPKGPTPLLAKITVGAAVIFMLTSLSLALLTTKRYSATIRQVKPVAPVTVPAKKAMPKSPIKFGSQVVPKSQLPEKLKEEIEKGKKAAPLHKKRPVSQGTSQGQKTKGSNAHK
jgi:preprotein translocase subunit SecG